jgi:hypothetical protein
VAAAAAATLMASQLVRFPTQQRQQQATRQAVLQILPQAAMGRPAMVTQVAPPQTLLVPLMPPCIKRRTVPAAQRVAMPMQQRQQRQPQLAVLAVLQALEQAALLVVAAPPQAAAIQMTAIQMAATAAQLTFESATVVC